MRKEGHRGTLLFLGFLLLAGLTHAAYPVPGRPYVSTALFCLNALIYAGLLLVWTVSLYRSMLPSRARQELTAAALCMLLLLAVRIYSDRIDSGNPEAARFARYVGYLPLLLIPTLFLMSCVRLSRRKREGRAAGESLLLLPALVLAGLILTNDLHQLVFRAGTVRLGAVGPGYYFVCGWIGLLPAVGVALLIHASRQKQSRAAAVHPLLYLGLWSALLLGYGLLKPRCRFVPYELPEIHIFCLLGMIEDCFRSRMIPRNRDYGAVFAHLELPAVITDPDLERVFETAVPVHADRAQLTEALREPLPLDADTVLNGKALEKGCAFWLDDRSTLNRLNEQLEQANAMLTMENELIRREQEQQEGQAAVEARTGLYARAAQAVYPAQKRIAELLAQAQPDTPAFRAAVARVLVLTAYVKRTSNFVMVEAERAAVTAGELAAALQESAHYLGYCGIRAVVDARAARAFPCREAMAVYDAFENMIEALYGRTAELWVRLTDRALLLMADCVSCALPACALPMSVRWEDGQLTVSLMLGGGET